MRLVITFVLLGLLVSPAWAAPVAAKWGFSTQAFNSSVDFGLIRGVSERRAWVLDFRVMQNEVFRRFDPSDPSVPDQEINANGWSIFGGPRLRSYTRAEGDLSPYWDVFLDGGYGHTHAFVNGSHDQRQIGVSLGSDVGIEYFTPWGLSVAAHSGLIQFSWYHIRTEQPGGFVSGAQSEHTQSLSVGITPGLYVRLYF